MNIKTTQIPLFIACLFLFSSCVSQPERVYTSSGKPEVTINAPLEMIKDAILGAFAGDGWVIENDTKYSTTMTKPCGDAFACIMGQALIGNSYSTAPKMEIAFSWLKTTNGNKVIVSRYDMSTQMAFGQVNRSSLLTNNSGFNELVGLLERAKVNVESNNTFLGDKDVNQTVNEANDESNKVIDEFLKQEKKYKQQYQIYKDTVDDPMPFKDWRNKTKQKAKG